MTSSVVTSFFIKLRNLGRAESNGKRKTTFPCNTYERSITRNELGQHNSKQRATELFALRGYRNPTTFVQLGFIVVETCDIGERVTKLVPGHCGSISSHRKTTYFRDT